MYTQYPILSIRCLLPLPANYICSPKNFNKKYFYKNLTLCFFFLILVPAFPLNSLPPGDLLKADALLLVLSDQTTGAREGARARHPTPLTKLPYTFLSCVGFIWRYSGILWPPHQIKRYFWLFKIFVFLRGQFILLTSKTGSCLLEHAEEVGPKLWWTRSRNNLVYV